MKTITKFCLIIVSTLFIFGCAKDISPSTYDTDQIGQASRVEPGQIISMRNIKIDQNTEVGGLAGAGVGAVAGSTIGGSSEASIIGAIGGALIGGIAGNAAEGHFNQQQGTEFIIKLDNGNTISTTQATGLSLHEGQHVLVIYGKTTRIVPDNTNSGVYQGEKHNSESSE